MVRTLAGMVLLAAGLHAGDVHAAEEDSPLTNLNEQMSFMGDATDTDEYPNYDAFDPAVAFNPRDNNPAEGFGESEVLLLTWAGDDNTYVFDEGESGGVDDDRYLVDDEYEIFARGFVGHQPEAAYTNQFRVSKMGPEDETDAAERARYQAFKPSVAYNAADDQFLVVWYGDDNSGPLVDEEYEIWGRLIGGSAVEEELIGEPFRITTVGPDDETDAAERARYDAMDPKVAWDPTTGGFMLVYRADDPTFTAASGQPLADDEFEVFAQRLDRDGKPEGDPVRVSTMGDDSETDAGIRARFDAGKPALAWNATAAQFLVAWHGDDNSGSLVNNENEIYVRAINPDGTMPVAQQRISSMGPDGDPAYDAFTPAVAVNTVNGEYMVSWSGDHDAAPLVEDEFEIFARRLATDGTPADTQFRVSMMGNEAETDAATRARFDAITPAISFNPTAERFQISWSGDDDTDPLVDEEFQVFGQPVSADGSLYGDRFKISRINRTGGDAEEENARSDRSANTPTSIYALGNILHYFSADGPGFQPGHFEILMQETSTFKTTAYSEIDNPPSLVPEPVVVEYTLTNAGSVPMVDTEIWYSMTVPFEVTIEGCVTVDYTEEICTLGDIPAGESKTLTLTFPTEGLEPRDDLATLLLLTVHSQTGLVDYFDDNDTPDDASDDFHVPYNRNNVFVAAGLKVDGGSGALLPLVPLLLLLWRFAAHRRD